MTNYASTVKGIHHKTLSPVTVARGTFLPECGSRVINGWVSDKAPDTDSELFTLGAYKLCPKCFS